MQLKMKLCPAKTLLEKRLKIFRLIIKMKSNNSSVQVGTSQLFKPISPTFSLLYFHKFCIYLKEKNHDVVESIRASFPQLCRRTIIST